MSLPTGWLQTDPLNAYSDINDLWAAQAQIDSLGSPDTATCHSVEGKKYNENHLTYCSP